MDFGPKESTFHLYGNNPSHIEQINIQPAPLGYHPTTGQPPTNVIRAPVPVKKKSKLQSDGKNTQSIPSSQKKKSQEHPQLKAMMVQAQRVAAAQQSQNTFWNSTDESPSPTSLKNKMTPKNPTNGPDNVQQLQQLYIQQQESSNRKVPNRTKTEADL